MEYNNKHPAQIETEHECDKSEVLYLMPIAPHFYSRCQNPVCALFSLSPLPLPLPLPYKLALFGILALLVLVLALHALYCFAFDMSSLMLFAE